MLSGEMMNYSVIQLLKDFSKYFLKSLSEKGAQASLIKMVLLKRQWILGLKVQSKICS